MLEIFWFCDLSPEYGSVIGQKYDPDNLYISGDGRYDVKIYRIVSGYLSSTSAFIAPP